MLGVNAAVPDIGKALDAKLSDVADAVTQSMREATGDAKQEWRDQIVAAGFGNRLANTIRSNVYPKSGDALNPAGYIYTKAPAIIDAFARGSTIRPVNGSRYLWIPTRNVPRRQGRGRRMDPEEVELHFNTELIILPSGKGDTLEAFIEVVAGRSRGYRQATRGRLSQGREKKMVLMFTLRRSVRMPKRLDLKVVADTGANSFARGATARLGR